MGKVKKFEDLNIFQMARKLCVEVYKITTESEFHWWNLNFRNIQTA